MFQSAFSDFHVTLDELIAEVDLVLTKSSFKGTHKGEIFGISAAEKNLDVEPDSASN